MKWYIGDIVIVGSNDQFFYSLFSPDILINVTCSATYMPSKCVNNNVTGSLHKIALSARSRW